MTRHGSHTESRMRENCTYGSMRGRAFPTGRPALLYTPLQETIPSPIPALVMVMRQDAGDVCRMTYGFELPSGWTGSPKPFLRVLSSPLHGLVENRAVGRTLR